MSDFIRHRRLRNDARMRAFVRETELSARDFIYPLFVIEGKGICDEIASMPGVCRYSLDLLGPVLDEVEALQVGAVILFGIPKEKDSVGSGAYAEDGIVQQAARFIKETHPNLLVIGDVCLCEYTDHGHCGVVRDGEIVNDETLELLAKTAVSQVRAGVDVIAPSDMMDGRVLAIRRALDEAGFINVPILSYAAKYASGFYGPFRDAAGSTPQFGDRRSYQMDPANGDEAMREVESDLAEGADMIIVKPALSYGDILWRVKQKAACPVVAYNVSGEYSLVKAAASQGWIDERRLVLEILLSLKRSGADRIITYHALDAAKWLAEGEGR